MVDRLIDSGGRPLFGIFDEPVSLVNGDDFLVPTVTGKRRSNPWLRMRYKRFQFIGIDGGEDLFGLALVDLRWLSHAFFYRFHKADGSLTELSALRPGGSCLRMVNTPNHGLSSFRSRGLSLEIEAEPAAKRIRVLHKGSLLLEARLARPFSDQPLRLSSRTGYFGWTYTEKAVSYQVEGRYLRDGSWRSFSPSTRAVSDWSAGFMRRETFWNWACASGSLPDGRVLGWNLAAGVNETGWTENAVWLEGRMVKLEGVVFDFARTGRRGTLHVRDHHGVLDLTFEPFGCRSEKKNLGLMASSFDQFCGRFSGSICLPAHDPIQVFDFWGYAEDHFAKW